MTYEEIHAAASDRVGPYCKNCAVCNGRACGNAMPGPGCKYPGNTAARNYDQWQKICVNMDTLCPNTEPDIRFEMFGRSFTAPIFAAPLGAVDMHYGPLYKDPEYNSILINAAAEYGVLASPGTRKLFLKSLIISTKSTRLPRPWMWTGPDFRS